MAEKEPWLALNPTARPANYRKARSLELYSIKYCKEQTQLLPIQHLNLETEALIKCRTHWTTEEIQAWLNYQALEDQEAERQVEAELVALGGFG